MRSKSIFAQFVAPTRSRRWAAVCLALYMLGLGLSATAQDDRRATIITCDVPGASQVTQAFGINPAGTIPGVYFDSNGVNHGYVRNKQGAITTFDVPAAGTGAFQGTLPESINPSGAITGQYLDASGVNHGFLRDKHGVITTFDARGAGTGAGQGTFPRTNNPSDAITGYYMDANSAFHGFLRIP